eukprot:scaffold2808_cov255-Pinguiococcus_pyrenoidosus.AAC.21
MKEKIGVARRFGRGKLTVLRVEGAFYSNDQIPMVVGRRSSIVATSAQARAGSACSLPRVA